MTYLSATELTNAQIIKQFPLSLEGTLIRWYYTLEPFMQANWNVKQKFNESFSEYLMRWRGKLSLIKQRPAESDQLTIVMEDCVPMLSMNAKRSGDHEF